MGNIFNRENQFQPPAETETAGRNGELSEAMRSISQDGLYFGPNFKKSQPFLESDRDDSEENSLEITEIFESPTQSYETLVQLNNAEHHLLDDILKTLEARKELRDPTQRPELYAINSIVSEISVPTDGIEIISEATENHISIQFVLDSTKATEARLYLSAIENDNFRFTSEYPQLTEHRIEIPAGLNQKLLIDKIPVSIINTSKDFSDDHSNSQNDGDTARLPIVLLVETSGSNVNGENSDNVLTRNAVATFLSLVMANKSVSSVLPSIRVLKQKVMIDNMIYNLYDIYGLQDSSPAFTKTDVPSNGTRQLEGICSATEESVQDNSVVAMLSPDCVICMVDAKNTIVLPCRHLCLCADCAEVLRQQNNKCPICRQNIHSLLQIDFKEDHNCIECPICRQNIHSLLQIDLEEDHVYQYQNTDST